MGSTFIMADCVRDTTIGNAKTLCAMTIADGVYSKLKKPRGPLLDSTKYRKSPTKTGGSPINVFITRVRVLLKGKLFKPKIAPSGIPTVVVITRAAPETLMDKNRIANNSLSKADMSRNAFLKPLKNKSTMHLF